MKIDNSGSNQGTTSSTIQESNAIELLDELSNYSEVYRWFTKSIKSIGNEDYDTAAQQMRSTVESMGNYIYNKCQAPVTNELNKEINLLFKNKLISNETFDNYNLIRKFGNTQSHPGNHPASKSETMKYYKLLTDEVVIFLNDYAEKDYSKKIIREEISDSVFFRELIARVVGAAMIIIGITIMFSSNFEDVMTNICCIVITILGLIILIGGYQCYKIIRWFR